MARRPGRRGSAPVYQDVGPQIQTIIERRSRQLGGVLLLPSLLDIARDLGYKSHYPVINAPDRDEYEGYPGIEENILSAATGLYVEHVKGYVGVPQNPSPSYLDARPPTDIGGCKIASRRNYSGAWPRSCKGNSQHYSVPPG